MKTKSPVIIPSVECYSPKDSTDEVYYNQLKVDFDSVCLYIKIFPSKTHFYIHYEYQGYFKKFNVFRHKELTKKNMPNVLRAIREMYSIAGLTNDLIAEISQSYFGIIESR